MAYSTDSTNTAHLYSSAIVIICAPFLPILLPAHHQVLAFALFTLYGLAITLIPCSIFPKSDKPKAFIFTSLTALINYLTSLFLFT